MINWTPVDKMLPSTKREVIIYEAGVNYRSGLDFGFFDNEIFYDHEGGPRHNVTHWAESSQINLPDPQ